MRVFLSFSFRDEDRDIVNIVERLLASHSVRLVSGMNLAGAAALPEAIKHRLLEADALLALFTRRDQLADGSWATHPWVRDEYGYALSINKPALALVEDGVEFGGIAQHILFDRRSLLPAVLALSEFLGLWRENSEQQQDSTRLVRGRPGSSERSDQKPVTQKSRPGTARGAKGVSRVFINYRREDAQGRAGRLADNLRLFLGERNVILRPG